jgi:hypothetical protein
LWEISQKPWHIDCKKILWEISQKPWYIDCKILMFEVKKRVFFAPWQTRLTDFAFLWLNYFSLLKSLGFLRYCRK